MKLESTITFQANEQSRVFFGSCMERGIPRVLGRGREEVWGSARGFQLVAFGAAHVPRFNFGLVCFWASAHTCLVWRAALGANVLRS